MEAPRFPDRQVLNRLTSKRLVVGFVVGILAIAFLSALGIKNAMENSEYQEEVQKIRAFNAPNPQNEANRSDSLQLDASFLSDSTN